MPIDLYRAKANRFQIIDGKLMPSLNSIDGMGDKAAEAVVDAAKNGKFLQRMISETEQKSAKQLLTLRMIWEFLWRYSAVKPVFF